MIAENIDGKWICEGVEVNPFKWQFRFMHDGKWHKFENDAEVNLFIALLPKEPFSLESWKAEANQLHNALFEAMYKDLDYLSEGEIPLWLKHPLYGVEASALISWWQDTCVLIDAYTDEAARLITPQEFIQSLPLFTA